MADSNSQPPKSGRRLLLGRAAAVAAVLAVPPVAMAGTGDPECPEPDPQQPPPEEPSLTVEEVEGGWQLTISLTTAMRDTLVNTLPNQPDIEQLVLMLPYEPEPVIPEDGVLVGTRDPWPPT